MYNKQETYTDASGVTRTCKTGINSMCAICYRLAKCTAYQKITGENPKEVV